MCVCFRCVCILLLPHQMKKLDFGSETAVLSEEELEALDKKAVEVSLTVVHSC